MSGAAGPAPDRRTPPPPGPARPFSFPRFVHRRLSGGAELYCAPASRVPLVWLELLLPGGAQLDPEGANGLAALTAALLDEGTEGQSALDIARRVERFGGFLASGADWESSQLVTGLLASHLDAGLELLVELATGPAFPESEVERLRKRNLAELRSRRARPAARTRLALARGLYPGTPYGGYLLGSEESVAGLVRRQVEEFYRRHLAAAPVVLAVGDLDPDHLARRLEALLGGALDAPPTAPPEIRPRPLDGIEVHLVDRPGAPQTELRIGHAGLSRRDPDWLTASLMNLVLGGKFVSRINLNLRERHGFTYGAHSRFARRAGPGPFEVSAAVGNEVALPAVREILAELERMRREPVSPDELEEARSYVLGVFPYTVQTLSGVASGLEQLAVFGLPDDYYDRLPGELAKIGRDDLLRVAGERLHPDRLLVVAAGPGDELRGPLGELGDVREVEP